MDQSEIARFRHRAYDLADTGRFKDGFEIAAELEHEGYRNAVSRIKHDALFQAMLKARCDHARGGPPA